MPRLFTKTDLARCARLALRHYEASITAGPEGEVTGNDERAISRAVDEVVEAGPEVYTRGQVEQVIRCAAEFGVIEAMKLL